MTTKGYARLDTGARLSRACPVERGPIVAVIGAALEAAKGWPVDWYSSFGSDFNYDFQVTVDPSVAPPVYNYEPVEVSESTEVGGHSCFLADGAKIFHTYSTYARGSDPTIGAYALLDLTALGRHEDWEEPKGRVAEPHPADPTFTS